MQGRRKISVPIIRLIGKQLLKCDTTPSVVDHSHIAPSQHRLHLLDGFIFPATSHWIRRAGGLHPWFMSLPLQRDERQIETGSDGGEWGGVGGETHVTAVSWSLFTKSAFLQVKQKQNKTSGYKWGKSNNWFGARTAGCCARIKKTWRCNDTSHTRVLHTRTKTAHMLTTAITHPLNVWRHTP